jgi:hypothetical protein
MELFEAPMGGASSSSARIVTDTSPSRDRKARQRNRQLVPNGTSAPSVAALEEEFKAVSTERTTVDSELEKVQVKDIGLHIKLGKVVQSCLAEACGLQAVLRASKPEGIGGEEVPPHG